MGATEVAAPANAALNRQSRVACVERTTMFDASFVKQMISRSSENPTDRRRFLRAAGFAGAGVATAGIASRAGVASAAEADSYGAPSDAAVLNFALNLEYLEAEFYLHAVTGSGLPANLTGGKGNMGGVFGGRQVHFKTPAIQQFAKEISGDELAHVTFLRSALGSAKVARPAISIYSAFVSAARAAGLVGPHDDFDVYASEENFLLGAFIFEDVGVTAYKGAAPLISNKTYLGAAAGILAVEAYHAAGIRALLYAKGLGTAANAISGARDSLDGPTDDDQGVIVNGKVNLVPADSNGLAFGRSTGDVLNVVYLTPESARKGGFFPTGVNGSINTSNDNA